ncbi:aminotransferase class V-fold PLP-dependent enzyme [Paraconexibacter sp.]|uniref:aminotransferase class V-fold PLP-dependent enzyme n=1 Tax=Paraconexibacter sp. TaxID=2949640 RepID=UPI003562C071
MSSPVALRAHFPVLETTAYLNAGTCGPLPAAALQAGADSALAAAEEGRSTAYYERLVEARDGLRARYAERLGAAAPEDVAITSSTSEGMARVLTGLDLRSGDEIVTADDEHPGLLGPLSAARRLRGITVKVVPLRVIDQHIGRRTKLVACSHVHWATGELAPEGLANRPAGVPLLLDGAQGAGAVPVDVGTLRCDFYAAAGQKWLCGPIGLGMLWISPAWQERLMAHMPTYPHLADPSAGLDARPWPDARAHDAFATSAEALIAGRASHDVLADAGWDSVMSRAAGLASDLAGELADRGHTVAPRGHTTLVSWRSDDPAEMVERCARHRVIVRSFPGLPWVRASVGAWNDRGDIDRLLAALGQS